MTNTRQRNEMPYCVYIAGKMRNLPEFNFPAFFDAEEIVRRTQGWDVVNPARHDLATSPQVVNDPGFATGDTSQCPSLDVTSALRWDIAQIAQNVSGIVLLPGWEDSVGANVEKRVAEDLSLDVWYLLDGEIRRTPYEIIGLSGRARAGKDTAAQALVEQGYTQLSFAKALKDMAYDIDPFVEDGYFGNSLANMVTEIGWEAAKDTYSTSHDSVRKFLQRLGVAAREHIDPEVWVNIVRKQIKTGGKYVISDVRFPNEALMVRELGGRVVDLERPTGPKSGDTHVSEQPLPEELQDALIVNDGTVEELHRAVLAFAGRVDAEALYYI